MPTDSPDDHRLAWKEIPGGRGPCMFLVHDMLSSHLQWTPNLDCLLRHARPVLFDPWGMGIRPVRWTPRRLRSRPPRLRRPVHRPR